MYRTMINLATLLGARVRPRSLLQLGRSGALRAALCARAPSRCIRFSNGGFDFDCFIHRHTVRECAGFYCRFRGDGKSRSG